MLKLLAVASPSDIHQYRYLQALARAGVQIDLVDRNAAVHRVDLPLVTHSKWPLAGRRTISTILGPSLGNSLADLAIETQLKRAWQRSQGQICHVHWIDEKAWHCAMADLHPLVLTCYGSDLNWTRLPDHNPHLRKQKAEAIAQCDLFIADSEDMIALASELSGRDLHSLLLPIGINTDAFRPAYETQASDWRSALRIPEGATIILSPRLIRQNYRQDTIMKAFCMAVREGKIDAYIIFKKYLSDPLCVDKILSIASHEGMMERVRVIDEVRYEHLPILYSMVDFAVNFPVMDAFPVTFLECCGCEVPILSNRLPSYSSNGMAKYLTFVHGEDEYALSQQLVSMCSGTADLSRMCDARAHVVHYFDESVFICKLLSAYNDLLKRKSSQRQPLEEGHSRLRA
jgi:glycosyltransferase involved in cell wall biosynthesis